MPLLVQHPNDALKFANFLRQRIPKVSACLIRFLMLRDREKAVQVLNEIAAINKKP